MKHLFRTWPVVALLLFFGQQQAAAQMQAPQLPVDKNVRVGELDNGLTYYIRYNALPEKRAYFYIAQKVGSILEELQQRGLAHFLEHMAFNGTKNFPGNETGKGIVAWCETMGIKFGNDLNAYTSVDETVYNIDNVPVDKPGVVDSCLLILHDWSGYIQLDETEIDKERGVIREEWRSRNSGMQRVYTNIAPVIYGQDKYADCMPIGSIDVINNFPYQAIGDYYHKWYRPDLQGVVIVGDIDVDAIEAKLKTLFADIPKPANPAERIYYPVSDNQEPIVAIGTDKEISSPLVTIDFKTDVFPKDLRNTPMLYAQYYVTNMLCSMLNSRLNELRQSPNPPFNAAGANYGGFMLSMATKDALSVTALSKGDDIKTALNALLEEIERARRFGFTPSEYERAKANFLMEQESEYKEREKKKSIAYAKEYVRSFIDGTPIPGIDTEYALFNQMAEQISVEVINQTLKGLVNGKNEVVTIAAPQKEGAVYPTKEEVVALLKGINQLDLKPYVDKVSDEPLVKEVPAGGQIVKEEAGQIYGSTKLTLSNGVEVYLKPTDFKADEIQMTAYNPGGTSLYPDSEKLNLRYLNTVAAVGGVGNFSTIDLNKALAGKNVGVNAGVENEYERFTGSCAPKDFETMLQLVYLHATAPRKDTEAFESWKTRTRAQLESAKANPISSLQDSVQSTLYGSAHPRLVYMQPEMVDEINYDRILEIWRQRFANAGDFTFFFVGNIDSEKDKALIAKYLGALPKEKIHETWKDTHMDIRPGVIKNEYAKKQETPMATVIFVYSGKMPYTAKNSLLMKFMTQILNIVYTEEVREKEGGTYSVNCFGLLDKDPKETALMQIAFQTDPAKKEHLAGIVVSELEKFAAEGPTQERMAKVREYLLKQFANNQKENSYWMNNLLLFDRYGVDFVEGYQAMVNGITAKDIQSFARELIGQGNRIEVTMTVPGE
ncbi:MAG: insulinase family protein [Prevotellaceae bacterium]|jgi:zinc protease|nr:insulinase family protein [Prevotellaceae bacterium]